MKTVKFILPVVAIMAAMAGVFATGNSTPTVNLVNVTSRTSAPYVKDGTCDTDVMGKKCQLASGTVFYQYINSVTVGSQVTIGAFVADQPNNP